MADVSSISSSSGSLLADRRFAWGEHAAREGDFAGAADLFRQTLEMAPGWAPGWLALGEALAQTGEREAAIEAFRQATRFDVSRRLGAELRLAALEAAKAPDSAAPGYVRALFDQYAERFDEHLVRALDYRGPDLLRAAIGNSCAARGRKFHFDRVLDLGCGTGLIGKALWGVFDSIVGVDLSPKMLDVARASGLYNHVVEAEIADFLTHELDASADLVVAADVFVYIGDLGPIFAQCARVIEAGGLIAFSAQRSDGEDWRLGADLRYAHSANYLRTLAAAHDFEIARLEAASTRKDAGVDVPGLVCVLSRA